MTDKETTQALVHLGRLFDLILSPAKRNEGSQYGWAIGVCAGLPCRRGRPR
jgi:hypothetical protein